MLVTTEKGGAQTYTVSRSTESDSDVKSEMLFSGKIKEINLPLAFTIKDHKSKKYQEINCCFSALNDNADCSAEIRKDFKFLYKCARYAPYTHLIPMSPQLIEREESFGSFMFKRFAITTASTPATATLCEYINLFPCYDDVLPMMLEYFEYPEFYVSLLPDTAILNVKSWKKRYQQIPLKHVGGLCYDGHGHSHIHIVEKTSRSVSHLRQIKWDKLEFEEDEKNDPHGLTNPTSIGF